MRSSASGGREGEGGREGKEGGREGGGGLYVHLGDI